MIKSHRRPWALAWAALFPFLPLLEIYRSFFVGRVQLFGLALEELVFLLWVGALTAASFVFTLKERKKEAFLFLLYLALSALYLVLHGRQGARFQASLVPAAAPNALVCAYYYFRVVIAPACLIFAARGLHVSFRLLKGALKGAALLLVGTVVVGNLFSLSFISYADGNQWVAGGYLAWFSPLTAPAADYTAKGLFSSANELSAVLFALVPFVTYDALTKRRPWDPILLFLVLIAAVTVGTRTLLFGVPAAVIATVLIHLLAQKGRCASWRRIGLTLGLLFLAAGIALASPAVRMQAERSQKSIAPDPPATVAALPRESSSLAEEGAQKHADWGVHEWFLSCYPIEGDEEFWQEVKETPKEENRDQRAFKMRLARRIAQRNGQAGDALWGLGFTAGLPYAESDPFFQFILFGAVGASWMLLPYLTGALVGLWRSLCELKKRALFAPRLVCLLSLGCLLLCAPLAGHVFAIPFPSAFLAACAYGAMGRRGTDDEAIPPSADL